MAEDGGVQGRQLPSVRHARPRPLSEKDRKAKNGLSFKLLKQGVAESTVQHRLTFGGSLAQGQQALPDALAPPQVSEPPQLPGERSVAKSLALSKKHQDVLADARRRLALSAPGLPPKDGDDESGPSSLPLIKLQAEKSGRSLTASKSVKGFLRQMHKPKGSTNNGDDVYKDDSEDDEPMGPHSMPQLNGARNGYNGGGYNGSVYTSGNNSGGNNSRSVAIKPVHEDGLLNIATKLGMVREQVMHDPLALPGGKGGPVVAVKDKAKGTMTVNQVSPLGVAFKAFEKLVDVVRDPSLSTGEVVQRFIIPQTAQLRCRYCDLINEKLQNMPTFYVVHCWHTSFVSMMEVVRTYVQQLRTNVDDVYIWIDILCINQHSERTGVDIAAVRDVIQSSDRILLVLDRHGVTLTRTWVLWELWVCSQSERFDKLVVLPCSWSWEDIIHMYLTLDVSRSQATKERERTALLGEIQRSVDLTHLVGQLREALLNGAKRESQRAEKLASVNPKRFGVASSTHALLLFLHSRYGEAEEVMRTVLRTYDRFPARDVTEHDHAAATFQLASILREQGRLPDAERLLQDFVNHFRGMNDELYMDGVGALADILTQRKFFTKAEMLARKALEEKLRVFGPSHHQVIKSMLQLAAIAVAQKLYEESEEHLRGVLQKVVESFGAETVDCGTAYHTLALCTYHSNRLTEAKSLVEKALALRTRLAGVDHPSTLETRALQAEMLIRERKYKDAEVLLGNIYRMRSRSYGEEHHTTLSSMGALSDLLRDLRREDEADDIEKRIISVGRNLLRYTKIDKFRSLSWITTFLARRDHLLDKAAMFLAKAYIVFKEKLGSEHELTGMTKSQLMEIIDKVKWIGSNALEQAQIFTSATQFGVAEVMYKQAYSISKLVAPEADHKPLAQGLADALFGQGKVQEAKTIMRAAGLSRKGMKQNMPASYLRWLNTRVAKYMDKNANDGMFGEDDD